MITVHPIVSWASGFCLPRGPRFWQFPYDHALLLNKLGVSPLLLGALGLSVKGANILTIPVWSWHAAKLIGDHTKYFQREGLDCWHFYPFWFVHLNNCQENKGPWKCSLYKASNHYSSCSCFNLYPGQNQLNAV